MVVRAEDRAGSDIWCNRLARELFHDTGVSNVSESEVGCMCDVSFQFLFAMFTEPRGKDGRPLARPADAGLRSDDHRFSKEFSDHCSKAK